MPLWEVKFQTELEPKEFSYQKNIVGYLEKKLTRFGTKVVSTDSEVTGSKAEGYTLTAVVTYKSDREFYPKLLDFPARWRPVFNQAKWKAKFNRNREQREQQEEEE